MVYFIQAEWGGPIKIGTTIRLSVRLKALSAEAGEALRVLGVIDGDRAVESGFHERFAHIRIYGEWFEPEDELTDFIAVNSREWDGADEAYKLISVKVDAEAVQTARNVATFRGIPLAEYLSRVVGETASREWQEILDEEQKRLGSKGRKPK